MTLTYFLFWMFFSMTWSFARSIVALNFSSFRSSSSVFCSYVLTLCWTKRWARIELFASMLSTLDQTVHSTLHRLRIYTIGGLDLEILVNRYWRMSDFSFRMKSITSLSSNNNLINDDISPINLYIFHRNFAVSTITLKSIWITSWSSKIWRNFLLFFQNCTILMNYRSKVVWVFYCIVNRNMKSIDLGNTDK